MQTIIDLYALMAYLITDVLAILSVIGSSIILVGRIFSALTGYHFRAPERIYLWSIGGLIFGLVGFASLALSDQVSQIDSTAFFKLRLSTVGLLYGLSATLLVVSQFLKRRPRRITFPKSHPAIKPTRRA